MHHCTETCDWQICSGCVKHVVNLDLTVARTDSHDSGTGRVADPSGGPQVGEHAPGGITTKYHSCGEALRQNTDRAGKARRMWRYRS